MNFVLEFHDSEIFEVNDSDNALRLLLKDAVIHCSIGSPDVEDGDIYLQEVEIVLLGSKTNSSIETGLLSDGNLEIDATDYNLVPIPFSAKGRIALKPAFQSGSEYVIVASSIRISAISKAVWLESYVT